MLTRPELSRSLLLFLGAVVGVFALLGHVLMGVAVAAFCLALVAIDAKPSWKRIFNTVRTGGEREGPFARAWHRTAVAPRDRKPFT